MSSKFEIAKGKTPVIYSIEYVNKSSFEKNKIELLKNGLPFIIRGLLPEYSEETLFKILGDYFGDRLITARSHRNIEGYSKDRVYEQMTFKDYISLINAHNKEEFPYAANNPVEHQLLELLLLDFPVPDLKEKFENPRLWVGGKGTYTPLHRDSSDNFTYHLAGKKKWTIFSIKDDDYLYFEKNDYGTKANPLSEFSTSLVNIKNVDTGKYPLYEKAESFELIINEGEVLYLPYGWGHSVENLTISAMINFWFELENYSPFILT